MTFNMQSVLLAMSCQPCHFNSTTHFLVLNGAIIILFQIGYLFNQGFEDDKSDASRPSIRSPVDFYILPRIMALISDALKKHFQ